MSKLRCHISISLDGFVAGPNRRRGARRHPPQVQEREMKRVAERP